MTDTKQEKRYKLYSYPNGGYCVEDLHAAPIDVHVCSVPSESVGEMIVKALNTTLVSDTKSDVERFVEILPEQDEAFQEALQPTPDTVSISRECAESSRVLHLARGIFVGILPESEENEEIKLQMDAHEKELEQALSTPQGNK